MRTPRQEKSPPFQRGRTSNKFLILNSSSSSTHDSHQCMENILLPSTVKFEDGEQPNEARLIVEPCYYGYGTTIGNALRRVLLSSLLGAAVTAVKLKGVTHEFQAVPHVKEDMLQIILNLKDLRLRSHSDQPVKLTLKTRSEERR